MKRRILIAPLLVLLAVCAFGAAPAVAAPVWNLDLHHNQTNFPPGGTGQYWVEVNNVGDIESNGEVKVTVQLPPGLTLSTVRDSGQPDLNISWACTGTTTVVCKTTEPIPRHRLSRRLILEVAVAPGAAGVLTATATLEGGGAALPAIASEPTRISAAPAGFGILPESFKMDFFEADALTPVRQAGSHPPLLTSAFDFNSIDTGTVVGTTGTPVKHESGSLRDIEVDLPAGFIGNPTAVGECTQAQFTVAQCPPSSQVGRLDASTAPFTSAFPVFNLTTGIFNLTHPRGAVTDLGFVVGGNPVHIKASLDPENDYAIKTTIPNVNETLPPFNSKATIWGVPADPSHNSERCQQFSPPGNTNGGLTNAECGTDHARVPFLTVPVRCGGANVMALHSYDSWQEPGVFGPDITYPLPGQFTGCDKPIFRPSVKIEPTSQQANAPTGLNVNIEVPQNENPNSVASPPVKSTVVTLPQGMSFSPSFADGLQSCTEAQVGMRNGVPNDEPVQCPDASRIGEVTLATPLLPKPAEGSIYLAAQKQNPFGSLFALYLVIHDTEERGVLVKLPGKIELDQRTGQITTSFKDTPQFPFKNLTLKFRSGPRAPLVNPPSCGAQTIGVKISSWARPDETLDVSSSYQVTEGANGAPCSGAAQRPFDPKMEAGTLNPSAGSYSPFVFRLARQDQEQELSGVTTILPQGLVAKIADVQTCSDAALASISEAEGTGAAEAASSACPAGSQVGTLWAGLGAGPNLNYFPGKVFLAGPYKGAPLSLAIVTPGIAGPFDLGSVVVRAAVRVDRSTAQVTAVSDPFPTILHGVLLRVRDVRLRVDRPETTLNPTSCDRMSVDGQISSTSGALAKESSPFQVGDCASLGFKPKLGFRLFGGTRRGSFPKLRATVTYPKRGLYANIARASVALPHSEFLEQGHIRTVCTRVQFAANSCPKGSIYGRAVARTPLFGYPLSGPVYLRSSSHPLPDMVAVLRGPDSQPIEVDLVGRIDSVHGGIRNTFDVVPDAPVERFTLTLQGGKKGLLVNSRNLCAGKPARATAKFTGQNGKRVTLRPALRIACKKHKAKRHRHRHP